MKHSIGLNFQQDIRARERGRVKLSKSKYMGAAVRRGVRRGLLVLLMPGEDMGAGQGGPSWPS